MIGSSYISKGFHPAGLFKPRACQCVIHRAVKSYSLPALATEDDAEQVPGVGIVHAAGGAALHPRRRHPPRLQHHHPAAAPIAPAAKA
jgi:hypothetical protein